MWAVIFSALSVVVCILCFLVSLSSVRTVTRASELPERRLRSVELQIESMKVSTDETIRMLTELANRVKMQKVRNIVHHTGGSLGEPDARADPEGWRSWKNSQLRAGQYNKG